MAFGVSRTRDFVVLLSFVSVKDFFECWRVALVESRQPTRPGMVITRRKDRAHMQLLGSRQVEETT